MVGQTEKLHSQEPLGATGPWLGAVVSLMYRKSYFSSSRNFILIILGSAET